MPATLSDVARAAGVSTSTASRALSGSPLVNEATRQRIRLIAQQLDYRPSPAAQGLLSGQTKNIGLIVPDLLNPFFADIVKGAQERARAVGYSVFIADTDDNPRSELHSLTSMSDQIDGALLCTPQSPDEEILAMSATVPLVLLHRRIPGLSHVISDVEGGVRQALQNLSALGHRTIAYVDGPVQSWSAGERRHALEARLADIPLEVVTVGHFAAKFDGGVAAADLVLATEATAVLAFNDIVALGLLNRLSARGVRVPDDLSVVGFDDVAVASMVSPALTTVAQPLAASGHLATDLLVDQILGRRTGTVEETLPTQLIVRGSTSTPRAARS